MGLYDEVTSAGAPKAGLYDDLPGSSAPAKAQEPSDNSDEAYRQEGGLTLQESQAASRGLIKGAASPLSLAADVGGGIGNAAQRLAQGRSPFDTAGDKGRNMTHDIGSTVVENALSGIGLKPGTTEGDKAIELATTIAGGMFMPGKKGTTDIYANTGGLKNFEAFSGTKGTANLDIAGNATLRQMGIQGEKLITNDTMNEVKNNTGAIFDTVRNPNLYTGWSPIGAQMTIGGIAAKTTPEVAENATIRRMIGELEDNNGRLNNEKIGNYITLLQGEAHKAFTGQNANYLLGRGLSEVAERLDDALTAGLSGPMRGVYGAARSQYRAYRQVLDSGALNVGSGRLDIGKFGRWLQGTDEAGYAAGRTDQMSDMYKVMKMGQAIQPLDALHEAGGAALPLTARAAATIRKWGPGTLQLVKQQGIPAAINYYKNNPAILSDLEQIYQHEYGTNE